MMTHQSTGDEMFSDTYKIKLVSEVLYEVTGKLETRKHGDIQLAGSNPSAEEADEGTDVAVESGVDIVLNHRLQETGFADKKQFTVYLKDYMKKWVVLCVNFYALPGMSCSRKHRVLLSKELQD